MFTNQSILETNADPYPSLISVIGQVPYLEPGQLFFYLFAIIIFTFLLGLMNAANTAFNNISESNIFQLKKSEETQDKKILALLDKPATLKAAIVIAQIASHYSGKSSPVALRKAFAYLLFAVSIFTLGKTWF